MQELIERVTIIATGVSEYNDPHLPPLRGPGNDVAVLRGLLVENAPTALYKPEQFQAVLDPDLQELEQAITGYALSRSRANDILVFYYSGHGLPIGRNDFGLCVTNTRVHPQKERVLPLSVLKVSDLMRTLYLAEVVPIIIIDACYSGMAVQVLPYEDALAGVERQIYQLMASKYALLCACADDQEVEDADFASVFTNYLYDVASEGIRGTKLKPSRPYLGLKDIFPQLDARIAGYTGAYSPRLYLSPSLPEFPFSRNPKYRPNTYSFSNQDACIIRKLWSDGKNREILVGDFAELCGKGAYGNHKKMSLAPWQLVETVPGSYPKKRRLTARGVRFARGKSTIPKTIIKEPGAEDFVAVEDTELVRITDFEPPAEY